MTQMFQYVHPNSALEELTTKFWPGNSLAELRQSIEAVYGSFPLLFDVEQREGRGHVGPGLVVTGLIEMPGALDREKAGVPFLGASIMGYCPAVGHEGAAVRQISTAKGVRWNEGVKPAPAVDPRVGSRPDLIGQAEAMPEPQS